MSRLAAFVSALLFAFGVAAAPAPAGAIIAPDGEVSDWRDAPYVVSVWVTFREYRLDYSTFEYVPEITRQQACTGTLIDSLTVLTAAHCLEAHNDNDQAWYEVVAKGSGASAERIEAKWVKDHQRYVVFPSGASTNDIGIIKLDRPVEGVRFPLLPPEGSPVDTFPGMTLYGWGVDQHGRTPRVLASVRQDPIDGYEYFSDFNSNVMLAAGYYREFERIFSGPCNGDSGGPLIAYFGPNEYLVGITSFGYEGCREEVPGAYTRVSAHRDWIALNRN